MVPRLLVLALEFYRAPLRFGHLTDPAGPLPRLFGDWLNEALAAVAPANLGQTADALAAEPREIEAALVFFVRRVLLLPQADHYRVLGLTRQATDESIRQHYSLLVRLFHPDRSPGDEEQSRALTARINAAYRVLRDPEARRRYDPSLPASPAAPHEDSDALSFFRPSGTAVPTLGRRARRSSSPGRGRRAGLWAVASLALAGLLLLITWEPEPPTLRIKPDAGRETASRPAYLQRDDPPARPDLGNAPVAPESPDPEPSRAPSTPAGSADSDAEKPDAPEQPQVPDPRRADGAAEPSPPGQQAAPVLAQVAIDHPSVEAAPRLTASRSST
jgi:curved DNA-binding protein CbpA